MVLTKAVVFLLNEHFTICAQLLRRAKVVQTLGFVGAKLPRRDEVEAHITAYAKPNRSIAFKVYVTPGPSI